MLTLPRFLGGLFYRFARREPQQQVMINLLDMWQRNRPLAHLWDVKKFVDEAYRRNTLVFACVKYLSVSLSEPALVPHIFSESDDERKLPQNHMLSRLLEHPNARQSQTEFFRELSVHEDVAGNWYVYKIRSAAGVTVQLRLLRPDVVRPIPDSNGDVMKYAYGVEPNVQEILAQDVIHGIGDPDPLDPYRGLSPIAVLSRMGDLDNNAAEYLRAFFLNAGIPSLALKYKTQVQPDEAEKARQLWRERYSGINGWSNIAVLGGDVEVEEIGSKVRTLDLESIFGQTESRICSTFGVPPILVGTWIGLMRSTYANYGEATKRFYRGTMKPKWISVQDRFTTDLAASEFGANLRCKFDLSTIDGLQEDKIEARKFALEGWNGGLLKRNEARVFAGFEPDEEFGDEYKSAPVPLGFNGDPAAPPMPALPVQQSRRLLPERFDALQEAEWKLLHRIADQARPTMKKKILLAIAKTQDGMVLAKVEDALADKNLDKAMDAIPWEKLEALAPELTDEITAILNKSAKAAAKFLPKDVAIKFDVTNPEATKWITNHAADLVRVNIVGTSKDAIKDIMLRSFDEGIAPRDAAKLIKEHIGLLPRHTGAVEKYRDRLIADGLDQSEIERKVAKYTDELLDYRAELIARTETLRASNEGQHQLWKQGLADGSLEAGAWEREWIVTDDDRTDPECLALEGATASIDGEFPNDGGEGPPLHPDCRCVTTLVRVKEAAALSPPIEILTYKNANRLAH